MFREVLNLTKQAFPTTSIGQYGSGKEFRKNNVD